MSAPIFVTGVGKRLGLGLAKYLISEGVPVVGTYRTLTPGIEELFDAGATLYQCDFYDTDQVLTLIHQVNAQHKSLRALIHNASDWLKEGAQIPDHEVFDKMMCIHAKVPYLLNKSFEGLLRGSCEDNAISQCDIIHISDYVSQTGSAKHIAYAASKAAMDNLTYSFAKKFAPVVKVNSIAPALMLFNEHDSDQYKQDALEKSLLPREGGLDEFLSTVNYLLESRYVTGRIIHLDGGRHLR